MEGEAISPAQSFLPLFQREGRFGKLALPLPRWQPAAGSGKRKFSLSAAGCPAPPVSPAMPGPLERRECESPAMPAAPRHPDLASLALAPRPAAGAQGERTQEPQPVARASPFLPQLLAWPTPSHTMAPDSSGAAARGTKGGADFRVSVLAMHLQAGLGDRAQTIRLACGCPHPTPDTVLSPPIPVFCTRGTFFSPPSLLFFLVPLLSLSCFPFLSPLLSPFLLLTSLPLSLPPLPFLTACLSLAFLFFSLFFKCLLTAPSLSVPLRGPGGTRIQYMPGLTPRRSQLREDFGARDESVTVTTVGCVKY